MTSWESQPQILLFHAAWLDSKNDFHGAKVKRTFRMAACAYGKFCYYSKIEIFLSS
jgi:hypothetical protein